MKPDRIRVLALAIIRRGGEMLLMEGYDPAKGQTFYRPLGGGVEFGERAHDALIREFTEELGAELVNISSLGTLENIFTFNGKPGHEIILLFEADFADETLYARNDLMVVEPGARLPTAWKRLADLNAATPLYPEGLSDLLASRARQGATPPG
jgi:ADP-ribose pyrophosphatase YjhB (NUDIX family)